MILDLERFLARERPKWDELDTALHRFEADRFYRPSFEESTRLFELYQHCAAALGRLQEVSQPELSQYLEDLVARAYAQIHSVRKRSRLRPFHWLMRTLPQVFRRQWRAFVAASLLLLLGSGTGVLLLATDQDAKGLLMPFPHILNDPNERVKQEEKDKGKRLNGHQI